MKENANLIQINYEITISNAAILFKTIEKRVSFITYDADNKH